MYTHIYIYIHIHAYIYIYILIYIYINADRKIVCALSQHVLGIRSSPRPAFLVQMGSADEAAAAQSPAFWNRGL